MVQRDGHVVRGLHEQRHLLLLKVPDRRGVHDQDATHSTVLPDRKRGSRAEFGSLLVAYYDGGDLHYAGHVGTGFDAKLLCSLSAKLRPLEL